jgi:hypothetical protein
VQHDQPERRVRDVTIAGSVANPNGFDGGMITAILNTNGGTIPDNCQG